MGIFHAFDDLLRRLRGVDRAILVKAVSFAMIGLVNTGIDFGVFTFTYYYLGWHIFVANPDRLADGGQQLLRTEFNDYICGGNGTPPEPESLHYIHLVPGRRADRQHHNGVHSVVFRAGVDGENSRDRASFIVDFTLSHLVVFRRREQLSKS